MSDDIKIQLLQLMINPNSMSLTRQEAQSIHDRIAALEAQLATAREALDEIKSWRNDTLGKRPRENTKYRNPEIDEAFDRGARMAFYRCADRAALGKDTQ